MQQSAAEKRGVGNVKLPKHIREMIPRIPKGLRDDLLWYAARPEEPAEYDSPEGERWHAVDRMTGEAHTSLSPGRALCLLGVGRESDALALAVTLPVDGWAHDKNEHLTVPELTALFHRGIAGEVVGEEQERFDLAVRKGVKVLDQAIRHALGTRAERRRFAERMTRQRRAEKQGWKPEPFRIKPNDLADLSFRARHRSPGGLSKRDSARWNRINDALKGDDLSLALYANALRSGKKGQAALRAVAPQVPLVASYLFGDITAGLWCGVAFQPVHKEADAELERLASLCDRKKATEVESHVFRTAMMYAEDALRGFYEAYRERINRKPERSYEFGLSELARFYGQSEKTIGALIKEGKLKRSRAGHVKISHSDAMAYARHMQKFSPEHGLKTERELERWLQERIRMAVLPRGNTKETPLAPMPPEKPPETFSGMISESERKKKDAAASLGYYFEKKDRGGRRYVSDRILTESGNEKSERKGREQARWVGRDTFTVDEIATLTGIPSPVVRSLLAEHGFDLEPRERAPRELLDSEAGKAFNEALGKLAKKNLDSPKPKKKRKVRKRKNPPDA